MSETKVSTYAEVVAALADQVRPVVIGRNLVRSEPKMVRRTLRDMIQAVREDETVVLSASTEKERARAERKQLLFAAQQVVNSFPLDKRDTLLDDVVARIRNDARPPAEAPRSSDTAFPEVSIRDWPLREPRRGADAHSARPLFVSPGRR
jgi:hypothetical protein